MEDDDKIELKPGLVIHDNYRLEKELGEGGMGVVWKAIDLIQEKGKARDSHVAIKFLSQYFKQHPYALKALVREFHRYKKLTHPKIVKAHGLDHIGDTYFLVMEFLKGIPLNEFIKSHKNGISFIEAKPIIKDMAEALAYTHQEGIAHLDFKPANVFYDPDNKSAKVIDFGVARYLEPSERAQTLFDPGILRALTPAYASYEMLSASEPDQRDDIYALACVIYELLSGKHPFNRKKATKAKNDKLSPTPLKGLNSQQNKALLRALAFDRDERTPTVEKFLAELFPEKNPLKWVLVGVIVLGLASFAAWEHFKPQPTLDDTGNGAISVIQEPEPLTVTFWLDSPGKTHFNSGDDVTLYYQFSTTVEQFSNAYFSLFRVSSSDKWALILNNEKVEADKRYSLPKGEQVFVPGQNVGMDARLRLGVGEQNFQAIVTSEPIRWESVTDIEKSLEGVAFWGMGTLTVESL
ncbi:MAG: serine/threonine-protein kinase [Pseudomonadota bacterium]